MIDGTRSAGDHRLRIAWVVVIGLALSFWLTSRYPALGQKAQGAGEVDITGQVGFDALVPVSVDDGLVRQIGASSVNWLWVNRQGMVFGILLGAAVLTLLSLTRRRNFESVTANTALGVVIGAPLGVCVNCAAPITHGLRRGGARVETALAAMFASPTYNVVVVSIAFALLPAYLVVAKLVLTFGFIILVIPWFVRRHDEAPLAAIDSSTELRWWDRLFADTSSATDEATSATADGLLRSARWVAARCGRNLWQIARISVPLMLVAAVCGAVFVTLLPFDRVIGALETDSLVLTLLGVALIAVVGLVMPVPIAFDVVIAGALWGAGLPAPYVAALFFTLGVYSIYSALVVRAAFQRRLWWQLAVPLAVLGLATGVLAEARVAWAERRETARVEAVLADLRGPADLSFPPGLSAEQMLPLLDRERVVWGDTDAVVRSGDDITIEQARSVTSVGSSGGAVRFSRVDGAEIGFDDRPRASPAYNAILPLYQLSGGAAGDVHGDGWDDVAVTSDGGVRLYANVAGEFVAQDLAGGRFERGVATLVSIVDIDQDADYDVVAGFLDGVVLLGVNDDGRFESEAVIEIEPHSNDGAFLMSLAAGDIDQDGRIDLATGWWNNNGSGVDNLLLRGTAAHGFEVEPLPGAQGQTLSMLLDDIDGDGWVDLLAGNDFGPPDVAYRNDSAGNLVADSSLIPTSTRTTMSFTAADFDGDLVNEYYIGQITANRAGRPEVLDVVELGGGRCSIERSSDSMLSCQTSDRFEVEVQAVRRERSFSRCFEEWANADVEACVVAAVLRTSDHVGARFCSALREQYPLLAQRCTRSAPDRDDRDAREAGLLSQAGSIGHNSPTSNVFLDDGGSGLVDVAADLGVDDVGWTWDTTAGDFDNDGDLDVSVVTGVPAVTRFEANSIFVNNGSGFDHVAATSGFADHRPTAASVSLDVDNDGDLDIITLPIEGAPVLYRNDAGGRSVEIDLALVRPVAGSQWILRSGDLVVRRDVIVGGGYASFDSQRVHIGAGVAEGPFDVEITWPDGERAVLAGVLPGHRYRLS